MFTSATLCMMSALASHSTKCCNVPANGLRQHGQRAPIALDGLPAGDKPSVRPTVRPSVRLYDRPSDRPSVRPSVRPIVRPTDRPIFCTEKHKILKLSFDALDGLYRPD